MISSLLVTGIGAVTSVGLDAVTTCASIRAGVARPAAIHEFAVLDREMQAPVPVTGHPVALLTGGFAGVGRWLQLAAPALLDMCRSANLPDRTGRGFWAATEFVVVAPVLDFGRFELDPAFESDQTLVQQFLIPLQGQVAGWFAPARARVLAEGRCGVLKAIVQAEQRCAAKQIERVVVLAVDSLLDAAGLAWLAGHDRLKQDENPVGLMPGEGAIALLVEASAAARRRRAAPLARLAAVATGHEPRCFFSDDLSHGEALAAAIDEVLVDGRVPSPYMAPPILDLNGEVWRAAEYGHARTRVSPTQWSSESNLLPAESVGDLGAAMTTLQLALACRSLARGYAGVDHVLCASSDEYGHVGAAVVARGE